MSPARGQDEARWWDAAALGAIALMAVALLTQWPMLPYFVDAYYHLNVAQAFREVGGITLHDFWEFAPEGRPHLYPPALHVVLASGDALGLSPIVLARLATVLTYPALLAAAWWCAREWFGRETAYWTVVCSALPFSFLLVACNTLAASWAMVFWLTALVALRRRAWPALIVSGALVFYLHLGLPWLMLASWLILMVAYGPLRRGLLIAVPAVLALASPWLWHVGRHRELLQAVDTFENQLLELPVVLYVFAGLGLVALLRRSTPGRWMALGLMAGLLPLAVQYRFRFYSGQGLVGMAWLAAIALTAARQQVSRMPMAWARHAGAAAAAITALLLLVHPTVFAPRGERWLALGDSALANLLGWQALPQRSNAVSFYVPRLVDPIVDVIRRETAPDEIIGCNLPASCGMFAALSHRATATGMLAEVRQSAARDGASLRDAHLVVWLKTAQVPGGLLLEQLRRYGLAEVAETDFAVVLRNPDARARRAPSPAVVPLWLAQLIVAAALGLIVFDLFRHPPQIKV